MALTPIAYTIPQYDYPNYWMKAYSQGTTTPIAMATDATGAVTAAKFEINADGFPVTSGDALVIPYLDGAYDLWLFPTEAEADANDTTNAVQLADNVTAFSIDAGDLTGTFDSENVSYTSPFTGSVATTVEAKLSEVVSIKDFGALGDGINDDTNSIQNAIDYVKATGGRLLIPAGTYSFTSLDIPDASNNNPIIIEGESRVSTVLQHTATSGVAIRIRPDSCWIKHITIKGAGSGTADGVYLKDTSSSGPKNCTLFDVQVYNFTGGAAVINDGFANSAYGLILTSCDNGWRDDGGGGHLHLAHSFISDMATYGIDINGALRHMQLDSVNIENSSTGLFSGSASSGVGNLVLNSCHFEGNTNRDLRLGNGTHDIIINGGRFGGVGELVNQSIFHSGDAVNISRIHLNGPEFVRTSGSHDGADNASILTDSSKSWTTNMLVGLTLSNGTDGSSGAIAANTATTITATLSGGTENDWDDGDTYSITGSDELINAGPNVDVIINSAEGIMQGCTVDEITLDADATLSIPSIIGKKQSTTHSASGALDVDWSIGSNITISLEANITNLTASGTVTPGKLYIVRFVQDVVGGHTVSLGTDFDADSSLTVNSGASQSTSTLWVGVNSSKVELIAG